MFILFFMNAERGLIEVKVIAYSGYRGEEKPRYIFIEEKKIGVELIEEWREEEGYWYKVKGDDNRSYLLKYDLKEGVWKLVR